VPGRRPGRCPIQRLLWGLPDSFIFGLSVAHSHEWMGESGGCGHSLPRAADRRQTPGEYGCRRETGQQVPVAERCVTLATPCRTSGPKTADAMSWGRAAETTALPREDSQCPWDGGRKALAV